MENIKEESVLKTLREALGLNQSELANILKMTPSAISKIEKNGKPLSDRISSQLSKEFGVREEWLKNKEGKMFADSSDDDLVAEIAANIINSDDKFMKNVIIAFNKLTEDQRNFLINFMKELDK
ncbi:helix-turn-helix domain-containing protein [Clostridioides difficile]|uniref:helix-turn-helix domain-containing protein n=1 Tax=Clostridioides difficile TaxID=1496 RepID=UPI00038CED8C|nr:helix-turn-helix transcriptional regulator [Clostridioides difficile]EGT3661387.1 XRE family transcriptional regulator [Clostridioides difficile]EGT3856548.1 XRE family transcriptional regulator [Clostridioides difficile]EGT4067923.1 XRE family transcriptional regulator [Clostridioides difficile]EGT4082673.1 XRE family transcriptional regulator [Clostridioides difficile]EGT4848631.1 XRE family transcriptional regulator [Clostridioides difficile]